MLTVVLACDASGKSRTRKPLPRPYSVMPSTDGPWVTPGGRAAHEVEHNAARKKAAQARRSKGIDEIMGIGLAGRRGDYMSRLAAAKRVARNGPSPVAKVRSHPRARESSAWRRVP